MATLTRYIIVNGPDLINFDLSFASVSLVGQLASITGTADVDSLFARPGVSVDFSGSGGSIDRLYLSGLNTDYNTVSNGSKITLTRNLGNPLLAESVILSVSPASPDAVVFANGTVSSATLQANARAGITPLLSMASGETSLAPVFPSGFDSSIKAISGPDATVFAALDPGMKLFAIGSSNVDVIYVKPGGWVNATQLGGGADLIYITGNWVDYTKVVSGSTITYSRLNGGHTETVIVTSSPNGSDDTLIFADGAVQSYQARLALLADPNAALAGIASYNGQRTFPKVSELLQASITALSADTGSSATDFITGTAAQTISGTYAGVLGSDLIQISLDDGSSWKTVTSTTASNLGGGSFSLSGVTLTAGGPALRVQTVNPSGQVLAGPAQAYVLDTVAPSLSWNVVAGDDIITAAEGGAVLSGTVTANASVSLTLGGHTYPAVVSGASWSYTLVSADLVALGQGSKVLQASATDLAGNVSTLAHPVTIGLSGPTVTINAIAGDNIINAAQAGAVMLLSGTCGSNVGSVSLTMGPLKVAALVGASSWSYSLTPAQIAGLGQGGITLTASTNADIFGNVGTSLKALTIDTIAPTLLSVSDNLGPSGIVNLATGAVVYRYVFSEAMAGLTAASFTPVNGVLGALTGAGSSWQMTLTPKAGVTSGAMTLTLSSKAVTDLVGNPVSAASIASTGSVTHPIDTLAPAVTLSAGSAGALVSAAEIDGAVSVLSVTADPGSTVLLTLIGSSGVALTKNANGSGSAQAVLLSGGEVGILGQGLVKVTARATDAAGNSSVPTAASAAQFDLETLGPTAIVTDNLLAGIVNQQTASVVYTYSFNQAVTGLTSASFTTRFGSVSGVSANADNSVWQVTVTPDKQTNGAIALPDHGSFLSVTLNSGVVHDSIGNGNLAINSSAQAIDMVAPPLTMAATASGNLDKTQFNLIQATGPGGVASVTTEPGAVVNLTFTGSAGSVIKTLTGSGAAQAVALTGADIGPLGQGLVHVTANATDAAGNVSGAGAGGSGFLGPFAGNPLGTAITSKWYSPNALFNQASIDADLLKLDNWAAGDAFKVYLNNTLVFSFVPQVSSPGGADGVSGSSTAVSGTSSVSWVVTSSGVDSAIDAIAGSDRVYHLALLLKGLGQGFIKFGVGAAIAAGNSSIAGFGLDNVVVVSRSTSTFLKPIIIASDTFEAGALIAGGWSGPEIGSYAAGYSDHPFTINTVAPLVTISAAVNPKQLVNMAALALPMVISGTVESGLPVVLQIGSQFFPAATSGAGWSYTLQSADIKRIGEGVLSVTAVATNTVGNIGIAPATLQIDTVAPTAQATSDLLGPIINRATGSVVWTYTFSDPIALVKSHFSIMNGSVSSVSPVAGSTTLWQVTVKPATNVSGNLTLTLKAGVEVDAAGNSNLAYAAALPLNTLTPTALVTDNITGTANGNVASIVYNYAFNEAVTGLTTGSFTATNGVVTNFSGSGSGYQVTLAPQLNVASGAIALTLLGGQGGDSAGNPISVSTNTAQQLDSVAPVLTVTQVAASTNLLNFAAATVTGVLNISTESGAFVSVTLSGTSGTPVIKTYNAVGNGAQALTLTAEDLRQIGEGLVHVATTATDTAGNPSSQGVAGNTYLTSANNRSSGAQEMFKNYTGLDASKDQVMVAFDMLQIGAWQAGELFYVYLNNQLVFTFLPELGATSTPNGNDGTAGSGTVPGLGPVNWTVTSAGVSSSLAGASGATERSYHVTLLVNPTAPGSKSALMLGLGGTLSAFVSNERLGLDNVVLTSRNAATPDAGVVVGGDTFENGAPGWLSLNTSVLTAPYASTYSDKPFTLRTVGPVLTFDQNSTINAVNFLALDQPMVVSGTVSSDLPVTLQIGALSVTLNPTNGLWSYPLSVNDVTSVIGQGAFTIQASATNSFGNVGLVTRPLVIDTVRPTVTGVTTNAPNGVNIATGNVVFTITFSEPVTLSDWDNVSLRNAKIAIGSTMLFGNPKVWSLTVTPQVAEDPLILYLGGVLDRLNNLSLPYAIMLPLDTIAPKVTLSSGVAIVNSLSDLGSTAVAYEAGDNNATRVVTLVGTNGPSNPVLVTFAGSKDPNAVLLTSDNVKTLGQGGVKATVTSTDMAGNPTTAPNSIGFMIATQPVTVAESHAFNYINFTSSKGIATAYTNNIFYKYVFSQPVTGLQSDSFSINNGTISNSGYSDNTNLVYIVTVVPKINVNQGNITLTLVAGKGLDAFSNPNPAVSTDIQIDTVAPLLTVAQVGGGTFNATAAETAAVLNVSAEAGATVNVALTNSSGVTVKLSSYTAADNNAHPVTLTPAQFTTLGLGLVHSLIRAADPAGNVTSIGGDGKIFMTGNGGDDASKGAVGAINKTFTLPANDQIAVDVDLLKLGNWPAKAKFNIFLNNTSVFTFEPVSGSAGANNGSGSFALAGTPLGFYTIASSGSDSQIDGNGSATDRVYSLRIVLYGLTGTVVLGVDVLKVNASDSFASFGVDNVRVGNQNASLSSNFYDSFETSDTTGWTLFGKLATYSSAYADHAFTLVAGSGSAPGGGDPGAEPDTVAPAMVMSPLSPVVNLAQASAGALSFTAEAGAAVTLTLSGSAGAIVKTLDASGMAQVIILTPQEQALLGQGAVHVTGDASDAAGNHTLQDSGADFTLDTVAPPAASGTLHVNGAYVLSLGDFGVAAAGKDVSAVQIDSAAGLLQNGAPLAAGTLLSAAEIVAGQLRWQPDSMFSASSVMHYHLIDTAGNLSAADSTLTLLRTVDSAAVLDPLSGSKFEVIQFNGTWQQAFDDAVSRGGHLATLDTASQYATGQAVWAAAAGPARTPAYVGLEQSADGSEPGGAWHWITGQLDDTAISPWDSGTPATQPHTAALAGSAGLVAVSASLTSYLIEFENAPFVYSGVAAQADALSGSASRLVLAGLGGADTIKAGAGDDRIVMPDLNFSAIDGGAGFNVLEFNAPLTINLPNLIGKVSNIEALALGGGAQVLTLSAPAVTAMNPAATLYLSHDAGDLISFTEGIGNGTSQWHTVDGANGSTLYQYFDASNHATLAKVLM